MTIARKSLQAAFALLLTSSPAFARSTYRCLLIANGRTVLSGPCDLSWLDKSGSFAFSKAGNPYFAYLNRYAEETWASWNESPDSTHADASLGEMRRQGACWINTTPGMDGSAPGKNKLCVWKK